jgi:trk system potassium uptake protein TrkH
LRGGVADWEHALSAATDRPAWRRQDANLRIVPLGFGALILVGTLCLALPWAHQPGHRVGLLDAFFLATSATCVTGLTPVNVGETFNLFGQGVLLVLIQLGGLGIFTASLLLVVLAGNRLSLAAEQTIKATVGRLREVRPTDVLLYACAFVVIAELAGAVALAPLLQQAARPEETWEPLWHAGFHAVSAFCNAGLSVVPEGMARWRDHWEVLALVNVLVFTGGIGLLTLINLRYYAFWRRDPRTRGRLTLQTRLCLYTSVLLIALGTVATLIFELGHTLASAPAADRVSWAVFHSVMTRTAGFNVVDTGTMNPPTLLITLALMFIGGCPGSMAGGIKTVTFVALLLTAWSALRRREEIQFWGCRLPAKVSYTATMIFLVALGMLLAGVGLLMLTEADGPAVMTPSSWLGIVFEAVSAFGTVGLSMGVTPFLTSAGKLVIVVLMFVGRIGPLMLAVYLARPTNSWPVKYPREEITLG